MIIKKILDISAPLRRHVMIPLSLSSQLIHLFTFARSSPRAMCEKGMLVISIDVDVGSKELAARRNAKIANSPREYVNDCLIGEIEEVAIPLFLEILNQYEVPVTFALVGQITEVNGSLSNLLESSVKHDIAAHGYYHRMFECLPREEAENELKLISVGMGRYGISPKSFVFPSNSVAHLDLLEEYGYKCYRDYSNIFTDGMYIDKRGKLYDVHPSLYLGQSLDSKLVQKILDISVSRKLPFHIWFHLWNFGLNRKSILKSLTTIFVPLLSYAKKKEETGLLTFETMLSATQKVATCAISSR